MRLTDIEFTILDSVSDDDYAIWETEWWLNGQYPEARGAANRARAMAAMRHLFDLGLVEVFWCNGMRQRSGDMTADQFYSELRKDSNWNPDETPPPWVGCSYTELGRRVLDAEFKARHPGASDS